MTICAVLKMGNSQLVTPSLPIEHFNSTELNDLAEDLKDTMQAKGGVGIAAPQIGKFVRVILVGFEHSDRYPNEKPIPLTIMINPSYQLLSDEMEERFEGCLSVPGLRGLVPRYKKIQYQALDLEGNPFSGIAEGFHARIIQHECDHIDGILFPHRVRDLRDFGFEDELTRNNISF